MNKKTIQLPITRQKEIVPNTFEISFDLSKQNFPFKAGQYIQVSLPKLLYSDYKGKSRVLSIASSPNNKDELSTTFRDSGSGFKRTLIESKIGTLANVEGPFGVFTLPKDNSQKVVFIAGGIGITPCLSMIRFANEEKLNNSIKLLYSNKNEKSAPYLEELNTIKKNNPRFDFENIFGRIDAQLIQKTIRNLDEKLWYVVGPPNMVTDVRHILSKLGINESRIYFEEFYDCE